MVAYVHVGSYKMPIDDRNIEKMKRSISDAVHAGRAIDLHSQDPYGNAIWITVPPGTAVMIRTWDDPPEVTRMLVEHLATHTCTPNPAPPPETEPDVERN